MVGEESRLVTSKSEAKQYLKDRQRAYQKLFGGKAKDVLAVLKDLKRFCRGDVSCYHPDAREHAMLEGRREVWLRIREHLDLTFDELLELKQ
jgi:hypothetical protein